MSKRRRLRGRQVVAALRRAGFKVTRIRGSHHFLRHPDGRITVVPIHTGEDIGPGLMTKIFADCELDWKEFEELS